MKINYDLKFKEELEKIKGTKPTLLLHVCCGPCSGNVLKEISEFFDITIYYSNSNIYPDTEYFRRFHELENFIQRFNQDFNQNIQVVEKEYQPKEYLKDISQYKKDVKTVKEHYGYDAINPNNSDSKNRVNIRTFEYSVDNIIDAIKMKNEKHKPKDNISLFCFVTEDEFNLLNKLMEQDRNG